MYSFLIVLIALIGLLLCIVILMQSGKGGGLAGIAAGGTTQILGTRQAPDVLEKASWILGSSFMVLCVLTNFAIDRSDRIDSVIQQRGQDVPAQTQPILPESQTQQAPAPAPAPEQQIPEGDN